MDIQEAGKEWGARNDDWQISLQAAREARFAVTKAFISCAAGRGLGPTEAQLTHVEELEKTADAKKIGITEFLKTVFG
jgi:hypothetical protein